MQEEVVVAYVLPGLGLELLDPVVLSLSLFLLCSYHNGVLQRSTVRVSEDQEVFELLLVVVQMIFWPKLLVPAQTLLCIRGFSECLDVPDV